MKQRTLDAMLDRLMDDLGHGVTGSTSVVKSPKGNYKAVTLAIPTVQFRTVFDSRELRPVALGDEAAYEALRIALAEVILAATPREAHSPKGRKARRKGKASRTTAPKVDTSPVEAEAVAQVTEGDAINEIYDGGGVAIRHTPPHVTDYPREPREGETRRRKVGTAPAASQRVTIPTDYVTDTWSAIEAGYMAWLEDAA